MSELEQWCEIDGHDWISYYCSQGLVLGPKTVNVSQICRNCRKEEFKYWVEAGCSLPVLGNYLWD